MKTTVTEVSKNVYLITFGFFEASKTMNISYRSMSIMYDWLIQKNGTTDLYGRFVTIGDRKFYDQEDHYDLAVSPEYVIRRGCIRLDSEGSIVSMKLEVLKPEAIGSTASEIECGFNNYGWVFVPRCYYEFEEPTSENLPNLGKKSHSSGYKREYVGFPNELEYDWSFINDSGLRYNTLDIWFHEATALTEVETAVCGELKSVQVEDSKSDVAVITFDRQYTQLVKSMLNGDFDFTVSDNKAEVRFTNSLPPVNRDAPTTATFTPEQSPLNEIGGPK